MEKFSQAKNDYGHQESKFILTKNRSSENPGVILNRHGKSLNPENLAEKKVKLEKIDEAFANKVDNQEAQNLAKKFNQAILDRETEEAENPKAKTKAVDNQEIFEEYKERQREAREAAQEESKTPNEPASESESEESKAKSRESTEEQAEAENKSKNQSRENSTSNSEAKTENESKTESQNKAEFETENEDNGEESNKPNFHGSQYFSRDFQPKRNKSWLGRTIEDFNYNFKRKKELKKIKELTSEYKKSNFEYFGKLLGEEKMNKLRRLPLEKQSKVRRQMVEAILSESEARENPTYERERVQNGTQRAYFKEDKFYGGMERRDIRRKLDLLDNKLAEIENYKKEIGYDSEEKKERTARRRYSSYIEKNIKMLEAKIAEVKVRNHLGDEEYLTELEAKLKELKNVPREKKAWVEKVFEASKAFTKEQLTRRQEKLDSPESKEKREKIKQGFLNNLSTNGKDVIVYLYRATLGAIFRGLSDASKISGTAEEISEFFRVLFEDFFGNSFKAIGSSFKFSREAIKSILGSGKMFVTGK